MNNLLMDIRNFEYEGQRVRTLMRDGEPWFVLADVCSVLDLSNPAAVANRLECDEVCISRIYTDHGTRDAKLVNESGLYAVILRSSKPQAKLFRRWVTSEVLPQIRKTGAYDPRETMGYKKFLDPGYVKEALQAIERLQTQIAEQGLQIAIQGQQIAEMRPKATYYDIVLQCQNLVTTKMISKDYGMSPQRLNTTLRDLGIQYKQSGMWFLHQKYADKGYTQTRTNTYNDGKGSRMWTYWTQKGRLFIYELLKNHGILPLIETDEPAECMGETHREKE